MILAALLLAVPLQGPEVPTDARTLLDWHVALDGPPADAEDAAWRTYVYLRAGAEGETRAAAAQLARLQPDGTDAERFLIEADCWSPRTHDAGLRRAESWLEEHGGGDPSAYGSVVGMRDFLRGETERVARVREADAAAGWLPFAGFLAFAAAVWIVRRGMSRGWL